MPETRITQRLTDLDYRDIRSSLTQFMQEYPELKDSNFEGSVLSILMRVLAYNTQRNAFYLNMIGSEMFLDSATRRESVVSHAKLIGYTPISRRSSRATVFIRVTPLPGVQSVIVPEGTRFETAIGGVRFTFQTVESKLIVQNQVTGFFEGNLDIVEGTSLTHRFAINNNLALENIIIPNAGVDIENLIVRVYDSAQASSFELYSKANDIFTVNESSHVYFVDETSKERHRVFFGDNVFGKKPELGNVVEISYLISSGAATNGASEFVLADSIANIESVERVDTVVSAAGGREIETTASIKKNAPLFYETQNRAVTASDYARIVKRDFSGIVDAISVWGGEDNIPKQFGFVFISIKPLDGLQLSELRKQEIEQTLKQKYSVVAITPRVVDPEFIFIEPSVKMYFDNARITSSVGDAVVKLRGDIIEYGKSFLGRFDTMFRKSNFSTFIDNTSRTIVHNDVDINVSLDIPLQNDLPRFYEGNFEMELTPNTFRSDEFTNSATGNRVRLEDRNGELFFYRVINGINTRVSDKIGVVSYETGEFSTDTIVLRNDDFNLRVRARPLNPNIVPKRNQILMLRENEVRIEAIDSSVINPHNGRV